MSVTLRFLVDGKEAQFGNVMVHARRVPYPGGHDYRLLLPSEFALDWMSELSLEPGRDREFDDQLSWDGLYWLTSVLSGVVPSFVRDPRYVINTIERIRCEEGGVWIEGACSPFAPEAFRRTVEKEPAAFPASQPTVEK